MAGRGGALDFLGLDSSVRQGKGAISALAGAGSAIFETKKGIESSIYQDRAQSSGDVHAKIVASMEKLRIGTNSAMGKAVDNIVNNFLVNVEREIKSAGGVSKVSGRQYSNMLNDLQAKLERQASNGGAEGEILKRNAALVGDVSANVRKNGLYGAGGAARRLQYSSIEAAGTFDITRQGAAIRSNITAALRNNNGIPDALRQGLIGIRAQLGREMTSASNDNERAAAIANAKARLESSSIRFARDPEAKRILDGLAQGIAVPDKKSLLQTKANVAAAKLTNGMNLLTKGLGRAVGVLGIVGKGVSLGISAFQKANSVVNNFARQQTAIAKERGAYGRMINGSGINPRELMTALHAGRRAGMDDATIISQQVSLQRELANARWGESKLTESVGRWGGTTYNADGTVKSQHEMMLEFSRILNRLGSKTEKLQFLGHIGYRPEQMEMIANYEKLAAKNERIRRNEKLQGTLERANILDENGYYARVDAATKIEYRRREIENQNAMDTGAWSYIKRMVHPDNWFFSDYTARQQGVASAKSESAMEALSKELKDLTAEVRKNGGVIGDGSLTGEGKETKLSNDQLKALSTASGWAEASKKNLGKDSPVHILEKALNREGRKSVGQRKESEYMSRQVGAGIGGGLGLWGGAVSGAKIGGAIGTFVGGPVGTAIGAGLGGLIGGVGGWFAGTAAGGEVGAEFSKADIFREGGITDEMVNELYAAAKSDDRAKFEETKRKYGVEGLRRSQVLAADFDKEVIEGEKIRQYSAKAMELTGGMEVDINQLGADKYFATMTAGLTPGSDKYEQRLIEAIARTSGSDVGKNEAVATILKNGISVRDKSVEDRIEELKRSFIDKGMGEEAAGERAKKQAVYETATAMVKDKDVDAFSGMRDAYDNEYDSFKASADRIRQQYNESNMGMHIDDYLRLEANEGNEDAKRLIAAKGRGIEAFSLENDRYGRRYVEDTDVGKEEFFKAYGYGSSPEETNRIIYNELQKKGLAKHIGFDKLPEDIKRHRIKSTISDPNDATGMNKRAKDMLSLGDDSFVSWLSVVNKTSEAEIRNSILSEEGYAKLAGDRDKGLPMSDLSKALLRIYESSEKFKGEKNREESAREEEDKALQASADTIATLKAAVAVTGGDEGIGRMLQSEQRKHGLTIEQSDRLSELEDKRVSGEQLTAEEEAEYKDLNKRERAETEGVVDRGRLIRIASAKGVDLSEHFSDEEIWDFNEAKEKEKEAFFASGGTEGQYKLFQDFESRDLTGKAMTAEERAFLEDSRNKAATRNQEKKKKDLPGLHAEEEDIDKKFADLKKEGDEFKAAIDVRSKGLTQADVGNMREIDSLKKSGMTDVEIRRRYGEKVDLYNRIAAEKSYREMAEVSIGQGSIDRKREELGEIGRAMSDEEIKKVLVEENVKERMAGYDAEHGTKGGDDIAAESATASGKETVEGFAVGNMDGYDGQHVKPDEEIVDVADLSEPSPVPKDVIEGFGTETKGKGKGDKTKAVKAREAAEKSYREMAEVSIGQGSIDRKREELGEIGRAMSDEEIKKVLVEENVKERMAGYDARTVEKGKKKSAGVVEAEVPTATAPSAVPMSGGAQAAAAPISDIVKAAGKGAPSTMAAVAEKAESAETAAASGSTSMAKEKSGGEESGGNVSVGNVTVNQTFNFKDQEGTPENLSQASKEGALQGVSEAVAEAAPSQSKY